MDKAECRDWAAENFGSAELGDRRRVRRLVSLGAGAALRPAGPVTQVYESSAEREAAFRFLENTDVRPEAVAKAVFDATARRCMGKGYVIVATDATSLSLRDRAMRRELGRVGSRSRPTRGLHVMNALAVDSNGVPQGLLAQRWWARDKAVKARRNHRKCFGKRFQQTETAHWVDTLVEVDERLRAHGAARPWFQLDRGGDAWPVFDAAVQHKLLLTVRAKANRRLLLDNGRVGYLDPFMRRQPVLGHFEIDIPAQPGRAARRARLAVRSCAVTIHARVQKKRRVPIRMYAVVVEEIGRRKQDRLRWMLLTTCKTETFNAARKVIRAYCARWRVEEFHRAWKSGVCNIEDTQLQSRSAILKWATILAAVAARAVRLAYLVRSTPEAPASTEFTEDEITAAFLIGKKKRPAKDSETIAVVIDRIADIGGFSHKYSGKKPGPTILARGLERIELLAMGLRNLREM